MKRLLYFILMFFSPLFNHGFSEETLIKVPGGYKKISSLEKGDKIISYDLKNKDMIGDTIVAITTKKASCIQKIIFESNEIYAEHNQLFFTKNLVHPWKKIDNILSSECCVTNTIELFPLVNVETLYQESNLYILTTKKHHNFFVSKQDILVHNSVLLGSLFTWIATNVEFSISIGLGGLILSRGLTNKEAKKQAAKWGYKETQEGNFNSHGQPKFKKGKVFISPDADGHNGGVWKKFNKKGQRIGTLDKNGERIKG